MAPTTIVKCPKCSSYMLTGAKQKTKSCPSCGATVKLQNAPKIASANSAFEASEMLKKLKSERGFSR
ncbi:MAG: DUF1922 domain-containing protein [Candidatus Bathyarchaeota archaeon]|nr:DUF1922 domain-containing protein [Candidatus Bathyarchaeota archaeon]